MREGVYVSGDVRVGVCCLLLLLHQPGCVL
jgi:hypothetical protein